MYNLEGGNILFYNNNVKEVINKIKENGYKAYIVGGAVRDWLLNRQINDFDICTNALPDEVISMFSKYTLITSGVKHGTVAIMVHGEKIEVTTFRKESSYNDNRHPDKVEFINDLYEDLKRRDFTINSMAYDNELIDYFSGEEDLKNKVIRTSINPWISFNDDALRILRALRFASVLEFTISNATREEILKDYPLLKNISKERIVDEFFKMIVCESFYKIFDEYYGVFNFLFELNYNDLEKTNVISALKKGENTDLIERITIVFNYLNYDKLRLVLKKYRLSNENIKNISHVFIIKNSEIKNSICIRRLLSQYSYENIKRAFNIKSLFDKTFNKNEKSSILNDVKDKCNTLKELKVSGNDLLSIGIEEKRIGEVLNELLQEVIYDRIPNEKNILLDYVKRKENVKETQAN